jgi:hypothetical protein
MGLVSLVPVLGWIAAYGWMLATLDYLRAGRRELPPAGFYMRRGWRLFLVLALYGVAIGLLADLLTVPGFLIASAFHDTAPALLGVFLVVAGCALGVLALVAVTTVLLPAIALATDGGGIRAGLSLFQVTRSVRRHPQAAVVAALLLVVAYAIGGAGSLLCGIGVVLTTGYSLPVMAGVLRDYENEVEASV